MRRAKDVDLAWETGPRAFKPSEKLVDIIRAGREKNLREVE